MAKQTIKQQGFTLIEVMVATLIIVVGVLGVAALQSTALKNLGASGGLAVAAMMANDMGDRMRANSAQALANAYDHSALPNSTPKDCTANVCSTLELAAYDVFEWQQQLRGYTTADGVKVPSMLTSAQGSVEQVGVTDNYLITIRWDENGDGSTGTECPPKTADDLDCYTTTVAL